MSKAKKRGDDSVKVVLALFFIFLLVQSIGLYVGSKYIQQVEEEEVQRAPEVGVGIFIYILLTTGVMLLIIKYLKQALKLIEVFAVFGGATFASYVVFLDFMMEGQASMAAMGIAAVIVAARILRRDIITQNLAILSSIIGVGALLGSLLGWLPALVFLLALTIYDPIAVYKTKHMVTMAKEITKQKIAFTFAIPTEKHVFQLGGGDLVIPLVFSVSVMRDFSAMHSIAIMLGGLAAVSLLFLYVSKTPGKAMPALPPITVGMLLSFAAALFFFGV
jgi:presenilin-like A22 family membrane protease